MAHKIDWFLDQEATTAIAEPKPIPELVAMVWAVFSASWAKMGKLSISKRLKRNKDFMLCWVLVGIKLRDNFDQYPSISHFHQKNGLDVAGLNSQFKRDEQGSLVEGLQDAKGLALPQVRKAEARSSLMVDECGYSDHSPPYLQLNLLLYGRKV